MQGGLARMLGEVALDQAGVHDTQTRLRPKPHLQPHFQPHLSALSPFVPPRQRVPVHRHVSLGTMGLSASVKHRDADGITDAPTVRGCIEGKSATNGNPDAGSFPFHRLPLGVVSPINIEVLEHLLQDYPCPGTRNYLVSGFRHGFDIGFRGSFIVPNARPRNLMSARNNVNQVSEAIAKELSRGHTSGPFPFPPFPHTHCSPIGSAPKPDGSVRLILDLSSPRGDSVNEGISQEEFSCKYSKFDDAVSIVLHLGQGAYLGKIDIKHAFRICPVAPEQWPLLCFQWLGEFFADTRLPFGSRSSPFIFNTFAVALAWIVLNIGGLMFLIHYLDDYFLANISKGSCKADMDTFLSFCSRLGVPIAQDKLEGPTTRLTYLGIEIDTVNMCVRLPIDKLTRLKSALKDWSRKKKCTKHDLLSLIGSLSFACKVVKPGRMFLRRLIDLSTTVVSQFHRVTLNAEARADIDWWARFLPDWNGVAIIHPTPITSIDLRLFTDASGIGLGCVYGNSWLYSGWRHDWAPSLSCHINLRELFAVWAAVFTWGHEWANREVVIFTDNQSIIDIWTSGTCTDKKMMALIRALFFFTAKRNINLLMAHIPGKNNVNADYLSRFQVQAFQRNCPHADPYPTVLAEQVWDLPGTT